VAKHAFTIRSVGASAKLDYCISTVVENELLSVRRWCLNI